MDTVIATNNQSATLNAVSNPKANWIEQDFILSAQRCAARAAKGVTKEQHMLNRAKLIKGVAADYRSHYPAIYEQGGKLPSETFAMVEKAVDKVILSHIADVTPENIVSKRKYHYFNSKLNTVTERVTLTGENIVALKEQRFGLICFIEQAKKRIANIELKPVVDNEKLQGAREQLLRYQMALDNVDKEIAAQNSAK
jgi:hypothetical protein